MNFLANRKIFVKNCLLKPARVLLKSVSIFFAVLTLPVTEAGLIYRRTETLEKERQKQSKQNAIPFSRVFLTSHSGRNIGPIKTE
jgi:hypothetical protein